MVKLQDGFIARWWESSAQHRANRPILPILTAVVKAIKLLNVGADHYKYVFIHHFYVNETTNNAKNRILYSNN